MSTEYIPAETAETKEYDAVENSIIHSNRTDNNGRAESFPIVCISGATLDLDVYTELIQNLEVDSCAAVVVINNLRALTDPLCEALACATAMPVEVIADKTRVRPNRMYVLQGGNDLHVFEGHFQLKPISKPTGWSNVSTIFLTSLAQHWPGQLFAVILAGYGGDGAGALQGIKQAGGITIAQKTTAYSDMPTTAIATGFIDFILPVENIAEELCGSSRCGAAEEAFPRCLSDVECSFAMA
jgi:chemotaxis response regulator CheB